MKIIYALTATLIIGSFAFAGQKLEAKSCKNNQVVGISVKKYKNQARKGARFAWRKKAKRRFGNAYANWKLSSERSQHCSRYGNRYKCFAKARPCSK